MAPRMNQVLHAARDQGALIIHAPSSCTDFYAEHPARKRAQAAPHAANLPDGIENWCTWNDDQEQKEGYPIDHSDGGRASDRDYWRGYSYYDNTVKRSLYIDNVLYTFSNNYLKMNKLDDLDDIKTLGLKKNRTVDDDDFTVIN